MWTFHQTQKCWRSATVHERFFLGVEEFKEMVLLDLLFWQGGNIMFQCLFEKKKKIFYWCGLILYFFFFFFKNWRKWTNLVGMQFTSSGYLAFIILFTLYVLVYMRSHSIDYLPLTLDHHPKNQFVWKLQCIYLLAGARHLDEMHIVGRQNCFTLTLWHSRMRVITIRLASEAYSPYKVI